MSRRRGVDFVVRSGGRQLAPGRWGRWVQIRLFSSSGAQRIREEELRLEAGDGGTSIRGDMEGGGVVSGLRGRRSRGSDLGVVVGLMAVPGLGKEDSKGRRWRRLWSGLGRRKKRRFDRRLEHRLLFWATSASVRHGVGFQMTAPRHRCDLGIGVGFSFQMMAPRHRCGLGTGVASVDGRKLAEKRKNSLLSPSPPPIDREREDGVGSAVGAGEQGKKEPRWWSAREEVDQWPRRSSAIKQRRGGILL